jgi:Ribonuclease G/E
MAEAAWIEHGIGETRAIVVAGNEIVEAHVERDGVDRGWRAGDVREVRLTAILVPGVRGIVAADGVEGLLTPLPHYLTEGISLRVAVVREALTEAGRRKLAKVVATTDAVRSGPGLSDRLRERGFTVRDVPGHGRDLFEDFGWSETVEAALSGQVAFPGGSLTISPTPAMTVIDVDGDLLPADLALAAADAVGVVLRRFDITGSIGVDFPTVADKAVRTRIGERLDDTLPPPFERTAVNGFGFAQIVRPRYRASFVETVQGDSVATAALGLLRRAEREAGGGVIVAAPPVIAWLDARPRLVDELARRRGGAVGLRADAGIAISAGYAGPRL